MDEEAHINNFSQEYEKKKRKAEYILYMHAIVLFVCFILMHIRNGTETNKDVDNLRGLSDAIEGFKVNLRSRKKVYVGVCLSVAE